MAGFIVPIITGLLPILGPAVVQGIEAIFPPKTGDAKMQTAVDVFKALLSGLGKAGVAGPIPSDDALKALIETVVQDLKSKGQLPAPAGTPPITSLAGMTFQVTGTMKVAQ